MLDRKNIEEVFSENPEIEENIGLLVDHSMINKTLTFQQPIEGVDTDLLTKNNVLKEKSKKLHIDGNSLFAYKFYHKFREKLALELSSDFKTYIAFLTEVDKEFNSKKFVYGYTSLNRALWAFAILESALEFETDYSNYLASVTIERNRDEIYSFSNGYGVALPQLEISVAGFISNAKILYGLLDSDADINTSLTILLKGIWGKVYANVEYGYDCYKQIIQQEGIEVNLLIPIISGIYDNHGIAFYKQFLKSHIQKEEFVVAIICGLSNVQSIKEEDAKLFLKLYDEEKNKDPDPDVLLNLPKLIFAVLNSDFADEQPDFVKECFEKLEELILIDSNNLIIYILREIQFSEKFDRQRVSLFISIIGQPYFSVIKHLKAGGYMILSLKDVTYFKQIVLAVADSKPFEAVYTHLQSAIQELITHKRQEFEKAFIELLINDVARYRFIGTDFFHNLSSSGFLFEFDILELDSIDQYKLWVVICQNYREPKYVIPCLLPLLQSNSGIVKEAFTCKLEEYCENYGGGVTNVLDQYLNLDDSCLKSIYERIVNYRDAFFEQYVSIKMDVQELNPIYTHYQLYNDFQKNYSRAFNRKYEESAYKSGSITSFFKHVKLLKGGGWKIEGKEEISKLGKFSSSFSLPRMSFIQPEIFDFERYNEMKMDWDESCFAEVNIAIENEQ